MKPLVIPGRHRAIAAAIAVVVTTCWVLPMRGPLWIDEAGTYWVVKDSLATAFSRAYFWSPLSLYYLIAWAMVHLGGTNELVMRLPSTLAMGTTAVLLYRIGRRLLDAESAALAVLIFAGMADVAFAAADARPYAFTLMCLAGFTLSLLRWLDHARVRDAAAAVLLAALTAYGHTLLAPGLVVPAAYAAWRTSRRGQLIWMGVVTIVLMVPLFLQMHAYVMMDTTHVVAGAPNLGTLLKALTPPRLVIALGLGLLAGRLLYHASIASWRAPEPVTLMLVSWAAFTPLVFFFLGRASTLYLFLPRYLLAGALPGALLAATLVRSVEPARARTLVAGVAVAVSGVWFLLSAQGVHGDGWRDAMATVRREVGPTAMPVLISSPFVEAQRSELLADPRFKEVLFAPELVYPPAGRVVHLPHRFDQTHLERVVDQELAGCDEFLLVSSNQEIVGWFRARMDPLYVVERVGRFHDLNFDRFRRTTRPRPAG